MKTLACPLLLGLALGACHHQPTEPVAEVAAPASVVGTWQLVGRDCNCPPGTKLPNQRLTLASSRQLRFYAANKLAAEGTYALATGSACGGGTSTAPLLRVALTTPNADAPHGNYTLRGDTLIIDQCLAADGPRYTFQRQR